jgi:hypothetical protein
MQPCTMWIKKLPNGLMLMDGFIPVCLLPITKITG